MNGPVGGKPETSRYTQALLAAISAVGIFFLALFLPNGWPRIALAVAVAAFLLYLYLVPRFWYRRIVNTILILWAGAIATPTLLTEAQLHDNTFLRFLVEGGGWEVHLPLCIAFIASLAAGLIHEIWRDRGTNESKSSRPPQPVIESQTNIVGNEYNADRDITHLEESRSPHHNVLYQITHNHYYSSPRDENARADHSDGERVSRNIVEFTANPSGEGNVTSADDRVSASIKNDFDVIVLQLQACLTQVQQKVQSGELDAYVALDSLSAILAAAIVNRKG